MQQQKFLLCFPLKRVSKNAAQTKINQILTLVFFMRNQKNVGCVMKKKTKIKILFLKKKMTSLDNFKAWFTILPHLISRLVKTRCYL